MKKIFLAILGLLLAFTLTACGGSDSTQGDNATDNNDTTDAADTKDVANEEPIEETVDETENVGTRANPYPFNVPAEVTHTGYDSDGNEVTSYLDITVLSSERGDSAYQKLVEANQYNEAAPEGYEWVLLKIKVAFTETDNENESIYFDKYSFKLVSESGDIYSGDISAVDPEPALDFEMYVGNEKEGYAAFLTKEGEDAVLRLGESLFFAIE